MNQYFLTIITTVVAAIAGWIVSRERTKSDIRRSSAETDGIQIKNVAAVVNFWKEQAEEFKKELKELKLEHERLYDKLEEVLHENELLREEMAILKKQLQQQNKS
jgi:cell shape-determining protein MreC